MLLINISNDARSNCSTLLTRFDPQHEALEVPWGFEKKQNNHKSLCASTTWHWLRIMFVHYSTKFAQVQVERHRERIFLFLFRTIFYTFSGDRGLCFLCSLCSVGRKLAKQIKWFAIDISASLERRTRVNNEVPRSLTRERERSERETESEWSRGQLIF